MSRAGPSFSEANAHTLLNAIAPGSALSSIRPFADDHHNETYLVEARQRNDEPFDIVVKRYINNSDVAVRARLEYKTLVWLQNYGVPVPPPIYLDESGAILGTPGIVTRLVSGRQLMLPSDHPAGTQIWLHAMAHMLAKIHSVPCDRAVQAFLQADYSDVLWFLRSKDVPDYMRANPSGEMVWNIIRKRLPQLTPTQFTFTHTDFWPGNILWHHGQITAVMDWEEAAYANPTADVAYCRMDMILNGLNDAADEFLHTYESAMGHPTANLGFWELAAAVRPMHSPEGWITESPMKECFQQFVEEAISRTG